MRHSNVTGLVEFRVCSTLEVIARHEEAEFGAGLFFGASEVVLPNDRCFPKVPR
jgi:hypothetical protein